MNRGGRGNSGSEWLRKGDGRKMKKIEKEPWDFMLPRWPPPRNRQLQSLALPRGRMVTVLEKTSEDFAKMEADTCAQEASDQEAYDEGHEGQKAKRSKDEEEMKSNELEAFRGACEALVRATRRMHLTQLQVQAPVVGLLLLDAMKSFTCSDRCGPLVDMISQFCAFKEFVRCLPDDTVKEMLRQLFGLVDCSFARKMPSVVQKKVKICIVCLVTAADVPSSLLMELQGDREAPFGSEDEPSPDNFLQRMIKKAHKKMLPAFITEGDAEGAEEEEDEYGDVEAHAGEEDGSDCSIHQFIAKDEAHDDAIIRAAGA